MSDALIPNDSGECEYEYEFSNNPPWGNTSFVVTTGLLDWRFVYDNTASTVSLFCCVPDDRRGWSVNARFFMKILPGPGMTSIINEQTTRFASDVPQFAFFVLHSQNAYVQNAVHNGQLKVTIKMSILQEKGLWPLVSPSTDFMAKNHLSNAELLVEGKKLYVNLDLLSIYSAFFATQMESTKQPRDSDVLQIKIHDIDVNIMKRLLRMIYYGDNPITDANVGAILIAANKLKFETILRQCEEFLLSKASAPNVLNPYDLPRLLQLAHNYDLSGLQNCCLKSFGPNVGDSSSIAPLAQVTAEEYNLPDVDVNTVVSVKLSLDPHLRGTSRTEVEFKINDLLEWQILLRKSYSKLDIFISPVCGALLDCAVNWCIQLSNIKLSLGKETATITSIQFNPSHKEHKVSFYINTTEENKTNLKVDWQIQLIKGLRYYIREAFAYTKGTTSTLKLQLDDKPLFSNLMVLAHFSPYFLNISQTVKTLPVDEESNLPFLILGNVNSSEMIMLMDQIYPTQSHITGENVEKLILLAEKFEFTEVVIKCVKFLTANAKFNLEVLQFAVNNKLTALENSCLAKFSTSMELFNKIMEDPFSRKINKEVKVILMDKLKDLS